MLNLVKLILGRLLDRDIKDRDLLRTFNLGLLRQVHGCLVKDPIVDLKTVRLLSNVRIKRRVLAIFGAFESVKRAELIRTVSKKVFLSALLQI